MTKHVRIENADNSDHKVVVETWDKGQNGEPDVLVNTQTLEYPCAMTPEGMTYIHSGRYLIVKEG